MNASHYIVISNVGMLLLCLSIAGCGEYTGVVPKQGYDTTPVSYAPKLNPNAVVFEFPLVDPTVPPVPILPLQEPHVWKRQMPISFIGEVQRFDASWDGTYVRCDISPILPNGALGRTESYIQTALRKQETEQLAYLINWRAPDKRGRYHVALKTIGPSKDFDELDTFVEGEIEVR